MSFGTNAPFRLRSSLLALILTLLGIPASPALSDWVSEPPATITSPQPHCNGGEFRVRVGQPITLTVETNDRDTNGTVTDPDTYYIDWLIFSSADCTTHPDSIVEPVYTEYLGDTYHRRVEATGESSDTWTVTFHEPGTFLVTAEVENWYRYQHAAEQGPRYVFRVVVEEGADAGRQPGWRCGTAVFSGGSGSPFVGSGGGPVDVISGQEIYSPPPDLVVRNPHGPDVAYQRTFQAGPALAFDGTYTGGTFAATVTSTGWTTNFDYRIVSRGLPAWGSTHLLQYPNGAIESLVPPGSVTGTDEVLFPLDDPYDTTNQEHPYWVTGVPTTTVGLWQSITLHFRDGWKWVFERSGGTQAAASGGTVLNSHPAFDAGGQPVYWLTEFRDPQGNVLRIDRTDNGLLIKALDRANSTYKPLLRRITRPYPDMGYTLVDVSVEDVADPSAPVLTANQRKVEFTFEQKQYASFANGSVASAYWDLKAVSQVVPGNATTVPSLWEYEYISNFLRTGNYRVPMPTLRTVTAPDPSGATPDSVFTINYNVAGDLFYGTIPKVLSTKDANGGIREYTYDTSNRKTTVKVNLADGKSAETRYYWDQDGDSYRITKVEDQRGMAVTYDYLGECCYPTLVTDETGRQTRITYDRPRDAQGNLTHPNMVPNIGTVTDQRGVKTIYEWDYRSASTDLSDLYPFGRLKSVQTVEPGEFTARPKVEFEYDADRPFVVKSIRGPVAGLEQILARTGVYDPNRNIYEYVNANELQKVEFKYDYDLTPAATDNMGNLRSMTAGIRLTLAADGSTYAEDRTHAVGTSFLYKFFGTGPTRFGRPVRIIHGASGMGDVNLAYDAFLNVNSVRVGSDSATSIAYNVANQPTTVTRPASSAAPGLKRDFVYQFPGGILASVTDTSVPGSGNPTQLNQTVYTYGPEAEVRDVLVNGNRMLSLRYDALYRVIAQADGNGNADVAGQHTAYAYDDQNGTVRATLPGGDFVQSALTYEANGHAVVTRTDHRNITATYRYSEPGGELSSVTYAGLPGADQDNLGFGYDTLGRVQSVRHGVSDSSYQDTRTYTLDDLGLPLTVQTSLNSGALSTAIDYTYLPDGRRESMWVGGRPAQGASAMGSMTIMAAPAAPPPPDPFAGAFHYQYDAAGRLNRLTDPSGAATTWTYDTAGRISRQDLPLSGSTTHAYTTYAYDAAGFMTGLYNYSWYGARMSHFTNLTYDALGNLTHLAATSEAGGVVPEALALDGADTLGDVGIESINESPFNGETWYTYGSSGRPYGRLYREQSSRFLQSIQYGYDYNYQYDNAGNPTTYQNTSGIPYNADNQRTGPEAYLYDGNGNPTTYRALSLGYDAESRLASFQGNGLNYAFGYYGNGLRAAKKNVGTGAVTYTLYDGTTPLAQMDAAGTILSTNVFGATGLLGTNHGASTTYYAWDPSGNLANTQTTSGGYPTYYGYEAYGTTPGGTPGMPVGFSGQFGPVTDETGLVLMGWRYYDPQAGRFLTKDPIGYAGGLNLYGYAGGNPVNFVDPLGLWGVQFGENGPNIGWGNPWLTFTGDDAVAGLGIGVSAVGSSFSFGLWNGGQAACDPSFGVSRALGGVGRDALLQIAGVGILKRVSPFTKWWYKGSEVPGRGLAREIGALSVSNNLNDDLIRMGLTTDAQRGAYYFSHPWKLLRNLRPDYAFGKLFNTGPTPDARAFLKGLYVVGPQAGQAYYDRDLWLGRP